MATKSKIPSVVIVGRTNVGKSTLFNKLAERQKALVSEIPGTTRDRNYAECLWRGQIIQVVDTGGLDVSRNDIIEKNIAEQSRLAIKQADLILFVVNLKQGLMPPDRDLAKELWKTKKPIILVGNKADAEQYRERAKNPEWLKLQHGDVQPVSALLGSGVGDLLDDIFIKLKEIKRPPIDASEYVATSVIMVGKPNVGKSSLVNSLAHEERFIVSDIAHTTREPNDTLIEYQGKNYVLVDTAGMRKKAKVRKASGLEEAGVKKTLKRLLKADIALLVLDVSQTIDQQDKHLAGLLSKSHVGVIIVANKWDLIKDKKTNSTKEYEDYIYGHFPFLKWAPVIFTSALTKQRITKILHLVDSIQTERQRYISENALDRFLKQSYKKHQPSRGKGAGHPKILRLFQVATNPPRFELIVKGIRSDALNKTYIKFLENQLREKYGFQGTTINIHARPSK